MLLCIDCYCVISEMHTGMLLCIDCCCVISVMHTGMLHCSLTQHHVHHVRTWRAAHTEMLLHVGFRWKGEVTAHWHLCFCVDLFVLWQCCSSAFALLWLRQGGKECAVAML